jgi:hypothetical protein
MTYVHTGHSNRKAGCVLREHALLSRYINPFSICTRYAVAIFSFVVDPKKGRVGSGNGVADGWKPSRNYTAYKNKTFAWHAVIRARLKCIISLATCVMYYSGLRSHCRAISPNPRPQVAGNFTWKGKNRRIPHLSSS